MRKTLSGGRRAKVTWSLSCYATRLGKIRPITTSILIDGMWRGERICHYGIFQRSDRVVS